MEVLLSQKTLKDCKICHKLGKGPSPKLREPVNHSSNPVTPHQRQGQVTMGFRTHELNWQAVVGGAERTTFQGHTVPGPVCV